MADWTRTHDESRRAGQGIVATCNPILIDGTGGWEWLVVLGMVQLGRGPVLKSEPELTQCEAEAACEACVAAWEGRFRQW